MWTELTPAEFNALWRRLDLGRKPPALRVPEQGATNDEAREIYRQAWQSLRHRQIATPDDDVQPEIAGNLALLARPALTLDLRWSPGPNAELRAVAAVRGDWGTLGVWADDRVWLDGVRSTAIATALVSLLGHAQAGPGRSLNIPADALSQAGQAQGYAFESALADGGVHPQDARTLRTMLDADRLRLGLFSAATRDQWGQTTRAPWVLNVLDTRQGRYAYFQRDGYLTVLPADNRRITGLLQELLQAMERR